jgi:prenyltransferase beta subunit
VALAAESAHAAAAATILGTLAALATLEHLLMILPVPAEALWRWSLANRRSSS